MAINHNQATVHIKTPFDAAILNENSKLNKTYIAYGSRGVEKMTLQAKQDDNAQGYSNANAVSRTISKSSHLYKNAAWDLVDASKEEDFDYEKINKTELPNALKDKSVSDIKIFISKKKTERESIQNRIKELNTKRKAFILKNTKENSNALENAMIKSIKTQAKKKNYSW